MKDNSESKQLAALVAALAATLTEMMAVQLRVLAGDDDQGVASKAVEPVFTKRDLAAHFKVSVRTIENWMVKGYLPYYKVGSANLFRLSDVMQQWDENYRVARRSRRP